MLILSDMILPSFKKSLRLRDVPGAYDYYPREFFNDEMSNASDVWSLGIIFLEMYYGHSIRFL
jgi:serine/threonine protein kinase